MSPPSTVGSPKKALCRFMRCKEASGAPKKQKAKNDHLCLVQKVQIKMKRKR